MTSNVEYFCIISLEIIVVPSDPIRKIAEPDKDRVLAVFFAINSDICNKGGRHTQNVAIILNDTFGFKLKVPILDQIIFANSENELFTETARIIQRYTRY